MRNHLLATLLVFGFSASPAHADNVLGAPIKQLFQKLAAAKHDRVFHADGVAYRASHVDASGVVRPAVVRVSRGGAGKPGAQDILGLAVKVPTPSGDQDFLMVTARGDRGIWARLGRFAPTLAGASVSSLTSFKAGGLKGAITTTLPETFRTPIDVAPPGEVPARQSFQLALRQGGLFRPARELALGQVSVHLDQPLSAEEAFNLRFTPFHNAAGIQPVGLINAVRRFAYEGSQAGRAE